jgi:hypothetical protein
MRKRYKPIQVMLNDTEHMQIKKAAINSGITVSTYIRLLITGYIPKPKPPPDYFAVIHELRDIGNNIHQVAVKANALHIIDADGFKTYSAMLDSKISAIQDAIELPERRN